MTFVMTYDVRNRREIASLSPNTRKAAQMFYDYCLKHGVEILITEGLRTLDVQKRYVQEGKSQTLRSYHLVGQAFDFVPIVDGKTKYSFYSVSPWKEAIQYAKTLGFVWGGDWKTFTDMPHLQFEYKGYGTDKEVIPSPTPSVSKEKKYTSLVDYLKAHGMPSDFTSRVKLASSYGVFGYNGTAEQNMELLGKLQK